MLSDGSFPGLLTALSSGNIRAGLSRDLEVYLGIERTRLLSFLPAGIVPWGPEWGPVDRTAWAHCCTAGEGWSGSQCGGLTCTLAGGPGQGEVGGD